MHCEFEGGRNMIFKCHSCVSSYQQNVQSSAMTIQNDVMPKSWLYDVRLA